MAGKMKERKEAVQNGQLKTPDGRCRVAGCGAHAESPSLLALRFVRLFLPFWLRVLPFTFLA